MPDLKLIAFVGHLRRINPTDYGSPGLEASVQAVRGDPCITKEASYASTHYETLSEWRRANCGDSPEKLFFEIAWRKLGMFLEEARQIILRAEVQFLGDFLKAQPRSQKVCADLLHKKVCNVLAG